MTCSLCMNARSTHLTSGPPLMAIRGSWNVVLNGTPMQEPATLVTPTNSGFCEQGSLEENTKTRNWTGTLLRGTVAVGEAKSSIWRATAYHPFLPIASYLSWHFLCNERYIKSAYLIIQLRYKHIYMLNRCTSCVTGNNRSGYSYHLRAIWIVHWRHRTWLINL